jgi:site-specific DNA-methyltransferase (adenine-specific)
MKIYNEDCITGARERFKDNSIDLIIADPPYGIDGDSLDKHYNREEGNVIKGYVEVDESKYAIFSKEWIAEAYRVLRPNGCMYVVSGWSRLKDVLVALDDAGFETVNHLIWNYSFGVYTKKKFVTSHYHILFVRKPASGKNAKKYPYVFNGNANLATQNTQLSYFDRQDVFKFARSHKPGEKKNRNQLPLELVKRWIRFSSNEDDTVCDFFMGGFTTAFAARETGRVPCGFELNKNAFEYFMKELQSCRPYQGKTLFETCKKRSRQ